MRVGQMMEHLRPMYPRWNDAGLLEDLQLPPERKIKHLSRGIRLCLRTRAALISAAFPIHSSNFNSTSNRSNQRACPVASIPTRT